MLELFNRRVRSGEDLVDALDFPLLGTVSSAKGMLARTSGSGAIARAGAGAGAGARA
jgi:hypothetical protein